MSLQINQSTACENQAPFDWLKNEMKRKETGIIIEKQVQNKTMSHVTFSRTRN